MHGVVPIPPAGKGSFLAGWVNSKNAEHYDMMPKGIGLTFRQA
jgi:hypothetical protein